MSPLAKKIYAELKYAAEISYFYIKSFRHSFDLSLVSSKSKALKKSKILLFCTLKNEAHRIPYFLNYYRALGIEHFVFVDNESTDGFYELVKNESDVTVYQAKGSYKKSNFGMHWINLLLWKHGINRWCLTCDPDEFLTYPYMDTRDLKDLTEYLDSTRTESLFTPMVDMYSDKPVALSHYHAGQNPLDVCPYFDAAAYSKKKDHNYHNQYVQGGVRQRVFSNNEPADAPALNKVCLIKWRWYSAYVESMHMALPRRLNNCCYESKTSGAVLHFKFISQLKDKVEVELTNKQHYNDSAEYKQYGNVIQEEASLYKEGVSRKFEDWKTLYQCGFINKGEW